MFSDHSKQVRLITYYQTELASLYRIANEGRSFQDLYGYLDRTSAFLGKLVLSGRVAKRDFILPISWLLALATNISIDLLDSFIRKYPDKCFYCLENPCLCIETSKKPYVPTSAYEVPQRLQEAYKYVNNLIEKPIGEVEPYGLDRAVRTISALYTINKNNWTSFGRVYKWFHLLRIQLEVAEIHEAYGQFKKYEEENQEANRQTSLINTSLELADVLAWILAMWSIMFPAESLDRAFYEYYEHGCPDCGRESLCNCKLYDSKPRSYIDFTHVFSIKKLLNKMRPLLPLYDQEIGLLIRSVDKAIQEGGQFTANVAISEVFDLFVQVRSSMAVGDGTLSSVIDLIDQVLKVSVEALHMEESTVGGDRVFLSYSTMDVDRARRIEGFLRQNNVSVFMSEKLTPGIIWEEAILRALKGSKNFLVLCSPDSIKSDWVKYEIGAALGKRKIIPVLYQCSNIDLPDVLRKYQTVDIMDLDKILAALD